MNDLPNIKAVLEHYGASIGRDHGQVNLKCPFHGDSHQSGTANLDDNVFVCFACGVSGNSLQIISKQEGINIREAARFAEGTLGYGNAKVPGKHLSGRRLPAKQGYNNRDSTAGSIRRSRGA